MSLCPYCQKNPSAAKPLFPFCCERCKMSDLGRWMRGDYKIAGPPLDESEAMAVNDELERPGSDEER